MDKLFRVSKVKQLCFVLMASFILAVSGCSQSLSDEAICTQNVNEFMTLCFNRSIDEMSTYCVDEREALAVLSAYGSGVEIFDTRSGLCANSVLQHMSFQLSSIMMSDNRKQCSVVVSITMPDYEAVIESLPKDYEDFIEQISTQINVKKVSISLKLIETDGRWLIDDPSVIAKTIYAPVLNADYLFTQLPCREILDSTSFFLSSNGNNSYINTTLLELDLFPKDEYLLGDYSWEYRYEVYNQGGTNLVYSSSDIESDSGILRCVVHPENCNLVPEAGIYFPSDVYRFVVYDFDGVVVKDLSCSVVYLQNYGLSVFYSADISGSITQQENGISPYSNYILDSCWVGVDTDEDTYENDTSVISMDIYPVDSAAYSGFVWKFFFVVHRYDSGVDSEMFYTSPMLSDSGQYLRLSLSVDMVNQELDYFEAGTYVMTIYDMAGNVIISSTCEVS